MCRSPLVLSLLTLFLLLSIGSLLAAIFGHAWWIEVSLQRGGTFVQGILRNCHYNTLSQTIPQRCMFRENILGFKRTPPHDSNGDHLDMVLLCLTIAVISQLLASMCSLTCTCFALTCGTCSTKRCWNCGTLLSALLSSIGAITSVGGMAYFEVKIDIVGHGNQQNFDETNWSYILGWIGAGSCILSALLAFLMIWMKPRPGYSSDANWGGHPKEHNVITTRNRAYEEPYY